MAVDKSGTDKLLDSSYVSIDSPIGEHDILSDDDGCSNEDEDFRFVYVNRPDMNLESGFCSNKVVTSRYTIYNFLPKILFLEFSKLANSYFLVISILQTIRPISNTGGFPASLPALSIIVAIDMFFAALEDYKRHLSDREANRRSCWQLQQTSMGTWDFVSVEWAELVVGDMIRLSNRDGIPADVVILAVHEPIPAHPSGICYVETKSLDGETNLKLRQGLECTYSKVKDPESLSQLRGRVMCETPNNSIHRFCGTIRLADGTEEPIRPSSMLLRGSTLRNTEWIYAMVINTGRDSKIMMTSSESPTKWSNMEKRLNRQILYICGLMLVLCLTGAIASIIWNNANLSSVRGEAAWYLYDEDDVSITAPAGNFFILFLYYFLLLNSFIPVSLYVSMTSVKFMQSYFMNNDIQMYHEDSDTPCQVRSMSLNEELGQIDYIFSDKTGTLTCNVMDFRKCSIAGRKYGHGTTEIGLAAQRRMGIEMKEEDEKPSATTVIAPYVNFDDDAMLEALGKDCPERQEIRAFFEHLAICHTVMPERIEGTGEIRLSASSPDEQALVAAAACFGYSFVNRTPGSAHIELSDGTMKHYNVLEVLEFNSTRKRMSVLVKTDEDEYILLCKGADTVMYERLRDTTDPVILERRQATLEHMEEFGSEGLRTLVIGSCAIDAAMYERWAPRFHAAQNDLREIELRRSGEVNQIDALMEEMEQNLEILGATAIEDRLQKGVPRTISQLAVANIKIWMLTGDKEETAINIGFACELLTLQMERVVISAETHCDSTLILEELRKEVKPGQDYALVIDGEALEVALDEFPLLLLEFAKKCKAVIACRVSPAQKAQMVFLIRENLPKARTLAIGDGANDVSMIQAAHIGVGISGQEGMQAANSSDYSIAQFRFLQRLLLVHGRWNYIRMAKLILYIFYKNVVMNLTQYWYMIYTGFSGQKFFLEIGLQGYNLLFTAVPILLVGIFEQDVPDYLAMRFPRLYHIGQKNKRFNTRVVWSWITSCIWESLIISFGTIYGLRFMNEQGTTPTMWVYGCAAFLIVVLVVNLKLLLHHQLIQKMNIIAYFVSISLWILIAIIVSYAGPTFTYYWRGVFQHVFKSGGFWLILPLLTFMCLCRDIFWKGYTRAFQPTYRHLAQEVHSFGLQDQANHLLAYPPPQSIATQDIEQDEPSSPISGFDSMKLTLKPLTDAVRVVTQPFRAKTNHHGFSFSYDAESLMAQSIMATERFSNLRRTFQRHGSRGSLAFKDAPEYRPAPTAPSLFSRVHPPSRVITRRHTLNLRQSQSLQSLQEAEFMRERSSEQHPRRPVRRFSMHNVNL